MSVFVAALGEYLFIKIEIDAGILDDLQLILEFVDDVLDALLALVAHPDVRELPVGRVAECFAFCEGMDDEIPIVPIGDMPDEIRLGDIGLDERLRTPSEVVGDIGMDLFFDVVLGYHDLRLDQEKSHERDVFERDGISHLSREEDGRLLDLAQKYPLVSLLVGIDADNGFSRIERAEVFLDLLDPKSDPGEVAPGTLRTRVWHILLVAAVVAEETLLGCGMEIERDITAPTEELIGAVLTDECLRGSATIEKQEHPLPGREGFLDLGTELVREKWGRATCVVEIDDGDSTTQVRS